MFGLRMLAVGFFCAIAWLHPVHASSEFLTHEAPWRDVLAGNVATDSAFWDMDRWRAPLTTVYVQRDYLPLWFVDGKITRAGNTLLQALDTVEQRGLLAHDYDAAHLRQLATLVEQAPSPERVSRADVALAITAMRLASDLQQGRVAPARVGYELDVRASAFDASKAVQLLAESQDIATTLDAFEPQLRHYGLLKASLAQYRNLARDTKLAALPSIGKSSVHQGEHYLGAPALRRLLIAFGDLVSAEQIDSATTLDEPTVAALTRFQERMGLEPDGVLGSGTYRALTVPLDQRVEQIALSLERVRWLPRTLQAPPIIVNIPQFRLFAFRTEHDFAQDILQMDVIVGATFKGRETPVFAANMHYAVLNPYWDVPFSIMKQEYLARIQADPRWVAQNGYEIVQGPGDDARPLEVTDANVRLLAQGRLRLRQVPGPLNALGRIKFMFPNRHNVYLHDTPARALFKQSRRAFSHGCIRVSDPVALFMHIMRDDPQWTPERLEQALNGKPATRIALRESIPVFILYGTALAIEGGETLFFDDIYLQDARLSALLAGRRAG